MGLSARFTGAWNTLRSRPAPPPAQGGSSPAPATEATPTADSHAARVFRPAIALVVVLGAALLGLFALKQTAQPPSRLAVFSVTLMLAAAAVAIGSLLGFLFGIPRSMQEPRPLASSQPPGTTDERGVYGVNTNLEQISDWLTKILVGVGLIQLGRTSRPLGRLVASIADGLGGQPVDRLMVGGILVFFSIFGFLTSYLLAAPSRWPTCRPSLRWRRARRAGKCSDNSSLTPTPTAWLPGRCSRRPGQVRRARRS